MKKIYMVLICILFVGSGVLADVVLREQNRLLGKDYSKGPMFKDIIPLSSRYESFARSDKDVFYCADTHVYSN